MARGDDQNEFGKFEAHAPEDAGQNFFLARVRATAEENRSLAINAKTAKNFRGHRRVAVRFDRIVLNAANKLDSTPRYSETDPSVDISGLLHADEIEAAKSRCDKSPEATKSPLRTLR